jgi:hypothetical protein
MGILSQLRDDRKKTVPLLGRMHVSAIPRPTTCGRIRRYMSEYYKLQAHVLSLRWIVGPCLVTQAKTESMALCLDCAIGNTEYYDSLDLWCGPQCADSHGTDRENLENEHDPNHRLVKVRTPVLLRYQGRAYMRACASEVFERIRVFCMKIAEFSSHPHEVLRHHQ